MTTTDSTIVSYEDRQAILDLISEYSYTYDEDRLDEFVKLFTDDAKTYIYLAGAETPIVETSSNAERQRVLQEVRSGPINQAGMPRHFQTNTTLTRVSANRISGRTMVMGTQQPYDGTEARILFTGVYEDEFLLSNGAWRFATRRGLLDVTSLPGTDN
jgi:hypothetical protein